MKLQENFKAYCDGELSVPERNQVREHLESNEADRKAVEDLQHLSKAIREYVTRPEPVGLEQTLLALEKAQPKARQRQTTTQQLRWVFGAAAIVACFGLIGIVFFPVFAQSKFSAKKMTALAQSRFGSADESDSSSSPAASGAVNGQINAYAPGGAGEPPAANAKAATRAPMVGSAGARGGSFRAAGSMEKAAVPGGGPNDSLKVRDTVTQQSPLPPSRSALHPLIQKDASLTVKVKSVSQSQRNLERMATSLGGFVQQSNRSEAEGQTGEATLALRIPVKNFDEALSEIRNEGDVVSDSSSGNDVTSDVVDMEARLRVLRTEESDYMVLLGRARRTGEIMEIRDKLTEIRTEIETITSQRNVTKDMAAYSTINVTLQQRPVAGQDAKSAGQDTWASDTWATAINGLSAAGKVIAQLFIFVLVWSPIWVPTALLGAWLYRRAKW